jgi:hypothetical protein
LIIEYPVSEPVANPPAVHAEPKHRWNGPDFKRDSLHQWSSSASFRYVTTSDSQASKATASTLITIF